MQLSIIFVLIVMVQSLVCYPSYAIDGKGGDLAKKVDTLISKNKIKPDELSILILKPDHSGSPLLSIKENIARTPASITKLVTAAATLEAYQPGFKFKTKIVGSREPNGGVYQGDIYLVGGGDPSFVSESMWYLVNVFFRNGINKITGDIVVDDSRFDSVRFDPSRMDVRVDRAFDAPAGAMSFNWNSVNIFVRPGKAVGDAAMVFVDPVNEYVSLDAKVKTVAGGGQHSVTASRETSNGKEKIVVRGSIPKEAAEVVIFKSITNPDHWAGYNLKEFLRQRGIQVNGVVRSGNAPEKNVLLAEVESKPIEEILADMNKFSNNYVAEMLVKNISAKTGKKGTMTEGMDSVYSFLDGIGILKGSYQIDSPSGLSRENRLTAVQMAKVLITVANRFSAYPEFISSLPIAGIDGTLKSRMKGTPAERWVRAKTGYLSGVISLAGFAGSRDGNVYPFVFIFNGKSDEWSVRKLFDEILLELVK